MMFLTSLIMCCFQQNYVYYRMESVALLSTVLIYVQWTAAEVHTNYRCLCSWPTATASAYGSGGPCKAEISYKSGCCFPLRLSQNTKAPADLTVTRFQLLDGRQHRADHNATSPKMTFELLAFVLDAVGYTDEGSSRPRLSSYYRPDQREQRRERRDIILSFVSYLLSFAYLLKR